MAITLDRSTVDTSASSISFSHTGAASGIGGVIVVYSSANQGDLATAVTYGGDSLTKIAEQANSVSGDAHNASIWLKGASVAQGTQTCAVTNSKGATKATACITLLSSQDIIEQDSGVLDQNSGANPSISLSLGGNSSFVCIGFGSGVAAVSGITPRTNWDDSDTAGPTSMEFDAGNRVGAVYTYDTIGTADVSAGYDAADDSSVMVAAAFKEDAAGGTINNVTLTDETITGALMADDIDLVQRFLLRELSEPITNSLMSDSVLAQRFRDLRLESSLESSSDATLIQRFRNRRLDELLDNISDSVIETYVKSANFRTLTDNITNALLADDIDVVQRFRSRELSSLIDESLITDSEIVQRYRQRLLQSLVDPADSVIEEYLKSPNLRTLTDTITMTDGLVALRLRHRLLGDLIDIADSIIASKTGTTVRTLTDTIDVLDSIYDLRLRNRFIGDTVDLTDTDILRITHAMRGDYIVLADSLSPLQRFRNRLGTDTIELTDTALVFRYRVRILGDDLTPVDSVIEVYVPDSSAGITVRTLTDNLNLSDEILTQRLRQRLLTESVDLTDSIIALTAGLNFRTLGDDLTVTDVVDRIVARNVLADDAIELTDAGDLVLRLRGRTVADTIELGESLIPLRLRQRILDNLIDITDGSLAFTVPYEEVSVRIRLSEDTLFIVIDDDESEIPQLGDDL